MSSDEFEDEDYVEPQKRSESFYKVIPSPLERIKDEKTKGRPRAFATPEDLWNKAVEYFEWVDSNPDYRQDFRGKDAREVHFRLKSPYTLNGFALFAGIALSYLRTLKSIHKPGSKDYDEWKDFLTVIACIEEVCYQQKFQGASNGLFNPNIIARDLGLFDEASSDKGQELVAAFMRLAEPGALPD